MANGVGLRLQSLSVDKLDEEGFEGSNPSPRTKTELKSYSNDLLQL
jgi:hypothetical protein